ncbi:MAG: acetyl-CoA acetyltransferase [Gammaproteobacteria bacterium RIFCSPHIGHO2_12_FULL_42_10]|nr:MAG: acetyl-CoA acetyltransferase [Gammaproteobacteria bacterium RIFCSPHIGHO2_12_FULL_42_10]
MIQQIDPVVIVSFTRTPIGNLLGVLKDFSASQLGAQAIQAAISKAGLDVSQLDAVIMGCVLQAGQGQAPARQAAMRAGLPVTTPCTTINKMCGSGMQSVIYAHDAIAAGSLDSIIAGGMESMTNAPYLLSKARQGYRLGAGELLDHLMVDGLEDAYEAKRPMGYFAERCAEKYGLTREAQDQFAMRSFERAKEATLNKLFSDEIVPLVLKTKQGEQMIDKDEHPFSVDPARIPTLSPIFKTSTSSNGASPSPIGGGGAPTVTAGNSSSIADGAAALVLMRQSAAQKLGITPIARIVGHQVTARAPSEFTIAPIDAIQKLLEKIQWTIQDVALFEINEAFAVVTLVTMQTLKIPIEKVNIHGGACALGHPIGASGARILVTLLAALKQNHLKRGIASLCIGGGEASAVAVEMV